MTVRRTLRSESGYSLVELLISTAIMMVVTGAIFGLVNPSQGSARVQPEVADLQQRLRVASDTLFGELMMSGAGTYMGSATGSLINFFAPIIPRRMGMSSPDAVTVARSDTITLAYVPNTFSQTSIISAMPNVSAELKVDIQDNCPTGLNLCGFTVGMDAIVFDGSGNFDVFTITEVQDAAAHLQHRNSDLSTAYDIGAQVTQIKSNTYYWCRPGTARPCPDATASQLRRYNGSTQDVALVDNVVELRFDYFGDPNPPTKPKPAIGVENCLYDTSGTAKLPTLTADDGSLAALPLAILNDGPFCGGGANQFDADLYRVRKIRVTLRVQVGDSSLRGTDQTLWVNPGKSRSSDTVVRDLAVSFEVTPRNINLAR
jgi:hypothetical protein